ncbi:UNVERIFIED_CONTAM: hypothetical protein Slati_0435900 [Sesamum latifolium]|uniref:Retrotransposon gag domain-containing protein n=1 Tax=Sesamum latifolium TaxID=2727402 RepID=A0AAW2XYQ8_9LAMI
MRERERTQEIQKPKSMPRTKERSARTHEGYSGTRMNEGIKSASRTLGEGRSGHKKSSFEHTTNGRIRRPVQKTRIILLEFIEITPHQLAPSVGTQVDKIRRDGSWGGGVEGEFFGEGQENPEYAASRGTFYQDREDLQSLMERAAEKGAQAAMRWLQEEGRERPPGPNHVNLRSKGRKEGEAAGEASDQKTESDHRMQPQIEALQKEIADLRGRVEPRAMGLFRFSPFSEEILKGPIENLRIPHLNNYTREKGDPRDHIDQFVAAMDLACPNEAMMCHVFRTTLTGRAQTWFTQLPPGSIKSFEQLAHGFIHRFASNKRRPKNPSHLFAVVQEEGESLKAYVQTFSNEILDIPNIDPGFLSSIMAQGLRNGDLADSLVGEPATTWDDLLARAEKFILIEESRRIKSIHRKQILREQPKRIPAMEKRREESKRRPDYHTPLRITRTEALSIAKKNGNVRWPLKMRDNEERQKSQKYLRGDITFIEEDKKGIRFPHEEALVISAVVSNMKIRRILVDSGSSVDILFTEAFRRMGLKRENLALKETTLMGFEGSTIRALGEIALPISLGEEPCTKTIIANFLIVDTEHPSYNIILGRPTLNAIGAVISTSCLKIKFPTRCEIGKFEGIKRARENADAKL